MASIIQRLTGKGKGGAAPNKNESAQHEPRPLVDQEDSRTVALVADDNSGVMRRCMITRREPGPTDVAMDIQFAGVCHSDVHQLHNDWGMSRFPMVPGHEIYGIVTAVGNEVRDFSVGDRVGVGCMVESCGDCRSCNMDKEQFCPESVDTYNGVLANGNVTYGGYSSHVVVTERFVCHIPETIPDEAVAPLLCAGITTYSPLSRFGGLREGAKVGVLGFGGLGHMALKIAKAAGAEVTVISRSNSKKERAMHLGADDFVAHAEDEPTEEQLGQLDVIINTIAFKHDVASFFKYLRPEGTLVAIGIPSDPSVELSVAPLIMKGYGYSGSFIGGMAETQEMLNFCGEHGIWPEIEVIEGSKINHALTKLANGEVPNGAGRYVIDVKNSMAHGEAFEVESA